MIRNEQPADADAIDDVHRLAFGGNVEARLVKLLRERGKAVISIVAEADGRVVGHILLSPVTVEGRSHVRALGLAPLAVLPEYRRKAIGGSLILQALQQAADAGYALIVVLGEPGYYQRFGFQPAHRHGLGNEYGVADEFMVIELRDGALERASGVVRYAPEFGEADG